MLHSGTHSVSSDILALVGEILARLRPGLNLWNCRLWSSSLLRTACTFLDRPSLVLNSLDTVLNLFTCMDAISEISDFCEVSEPRSLDSECGGAGSEKNSGPILNLPGPVLKLSGPVLKLSGPVLKSPSPVLKSPGPVLKISSPVLKISSLVLNISSPVLKIVSRPQEIS